MQFLEQQIMLGRTPKMILAFAFCAALSFSPRSVLGETNETNPVQYNEMLTKLEVDANKAWTIRFNKELDASSINESNIKVLDDKEKQIHVKITIGTDRKSIIMSPQDDYIQGGNYYLIIEKGIVTSEKAVMKKPVKMKFTIKNPFKVCIDAGDGGAETGIVGRGGTKEKDVNLSIALKTGKLLEDNGVQVIYTRKNDNIPWTKEDLNQRLKISDAANADYFISIHCNSSQENPLATGVETYYNKSDEKAEEAANSIDLELAARTGLTDRKAKEGSYPELCSTTASAIKVYVGFMSNAEEEKKLMSQEFQMKCAEAITAGILKYKVDKAPKVLSLVKETTPNYICNFDYIVAKAYEGQIFNPPQAVKVNMSDKTTSILPIKWDTSSITYAKEGTYITKGKLDAFKGDIILSTIVESRKQTSNIVCIDAGHGGYDPGAIGPSGIKEKDINLAIALKIGKALESKGIGVVFTRIDDNFPEPYGESGIEKQSIELNKRCDISNLCKTAYFISIHCNSFDNTIKGTETYYCDGSAKGQALADMLQKELINALGTVDRKIKANDYYVLLYTDAPAALVETAFISNPEEEKLLSSEEFQNKCANAAAAAIEKCNKDNKTQK